MRGSARNSCEPDVLLSDRITLSQDTLWRSLPSSLSGANVGKTSSIPVGWSDQETGCMRNASAGRNFCKCYKPSTVHQPNLIPQWKVLGVAPAGQQRSRWYSSSVPNNMLRSRQARCLGWSQSRKALEMYQASAHAWHVFHTCVMSLPKIRSRWCFLGATCSGPTSQSRRSYRCCVARQWWIVSISYPQRIAPSPSGPQRTRVVLRTRPVALLCVYRNCFCHLGQHSSYVVIHRKNRKAQFGRTSARKLALWMPEAKEKTRCWYSMTALANPRFFQKLGATSFLSSDALDQLLMAVGAGALGRFNLDGALI